MKVIEANAYRTFALKVPKADWQGTEERFRPHDEVTVHAGFRAEVADGEDPAAAVRELHAIAEGEVERIVLDFKQRNEAALEAARGAPAAPPAPRPAPAAQGAQNARWSAKAPGDAGSRPPTPKQMNFLRQLTREKGYTGPPPKTAAEASALIDRLKGGS